MFWSSAVVLIVLITIMGKVLTERYRALGRRNAPAEQIPIWVGAFGPRALALTGQLADGWIPSLGFAPPEAIPAMRDQMREDTSSRNRTRRGFN